MDGTAPLEGQPELAKAQVSGVGAHEPQRHPAHFFVAVHAGAGYHGAANATAFKRALKRALLYAARTFHSMSERSEAASTPVDAVVAAIASLEADPVTNAGFGSALTLHGKVECDASVMAGGDSGTATSDGGFGAVGAVSGVRSPITLAHAIMIGERRGRLPLGRVPPMFLVGEGARQWGLAHGVEGVLSLSSSSSDDGARRSDQEPDADAMVAPRARAAWNKYTARMQLWEELEGRKAKRKGLGSWRRGGDEGGAPSGADDATDGDHENEEYAAEGGGPAKRRKVDASQMELDNEDGDDSLYDTVGAICVDASGRTAAGVSSGGIPMKWEGRVGEAALYGCGCWASDLDRSSALAPVAVACSASGVGEQITKSMLSSATCHEMLSSTDEADVSARRSLEQFFVVNAREGEGSHAGFIALRATAHGRGNGGAPDAETAVSREDKDEDGTSIEGDLVVAHSTASMAYGFIDHRMTPRVYISRLGDGGGGGKPRQCCSIHPFRL